jgi:hypothetical protein
MIEEIVEFCKFVGGFIFIAIMIVAVWVLIDSMCFVANMKHYIKPECMKEQSK